MYVPPFRALTNAFQPLRSQNVIKILFATNSGNQTMWLTSQSGLNKQLHLRSKIENVIALIQP